MELLGWSRCGKVSCELQPRCQGWMLCSGVWLGSALHSCEGQSSPFQVLLRALLGEGKCISFCCGGKICC